jgi:crotonobetainyl-CoA:carnitine CoA-transferase CaiB-like acyl-CoA transferase
VATISHTVVYVKPPPSSAPPASLEGLIVADFSRVLAGPYLTMLLGDLGATVIKVESPEGDQTRGWGPPWFDGASTYYQSVNRNKSSVVLDLNDADDRELAFELATRADILIENLLPDRMRRFGLDYEAVAEVNDQVVYCSLSGFGSQPGSATLPGFDLVAQAASGLMSITGEAAGGPMKVGVAVVDIVCGLHAGLGVLAALAARERLGRGQLVEVNLLSSALSVLANQAAAHLLAGVLPYRAGNDHPSVAPYELFSAADGDVVIAAGTDGQFVKLCAALGLAALAIDDRFATNSARVAHRPVLRAVLDAEIGSRSRADIVDCLQQAGVPVGPVNDVAEAFRLAESLGLEPTWTVDGCDYVRTPLSMSATPPRPTSGPPGLDEGGDKIRAWLADPAERVSARVAERPISSTLRGATT